jgi:hypothetical protein
MIAQSRLDRSGVAENQRRVQCGRRDVRIERQQPFGAAARAAGCAADEFVDGCAERQGPGLDFFAQRRPRRESVLARDHGLRVVERQIDDGDLIDGFTRKRWQGGEATERVRVAGVRRMEQGLGLLLQLLEVWADGKLTRHHTTSMLEPVVRKQAARRCSVPLVRRI